MRLQAKQLDAKRVYASQAHLSSKLPIHIVGAATNQNSLALVARLVPVRANGRQLMAGVESFKNVQQDADRRLPPGGNPRRCRSR